MTRRLADLGPRLAPVLHRLDVTSDVLAHVGATRAVPRVAGEPALTGREIDVLVMLADRHSNKEIARDLLIAPATVKKQPSPSTPSSTSTDA